MVINRNPAGKTLERTLVKVTGKGNIFKNGLIYIETGLTRFMVINLNPAGEVLHGKYTGQRYMWNRKDFKLAFKFISRLVYLGFKEVDPAGEALESTLFKVTWGMGWILN